ncbi:MAG TPA: DUF374 domain-containing protein, partial [Polyangiaceae bacterium]|nr:DUF374 domain-containing protein [Polyangiaceae bacterium]
NAGERRWIGVFGQFADGAPATMGAQPLARHCKRVKWRALATARSSPRLVGVQSRHRHPVPRSSTRAKSTSGVEVRSLSGRPTRSPGGAKLGHIHPDGSVIVPASGTQAGAPRRRVDEVPWLLRPAFLVGSHALALVLCAYVVLIRRSSRIEYAGGRRLASGQAYIFAIWHSVSWPYFVLPRLRRQVALAHPHWFMKPVHLMLEWLGVARLILGSTGNGGRQAANVLVAHLRAGASTCMAPDGPAGPARVLKKGVLHVSAQTGVPIVPVRIRCSRSVTLRSWDRKIIPLPFGTIRVHFAAPIRVDPADLAAAQAALEAEL